MIKDKRDLGYYLEADRIAMDVKGRRPHIIARYESDYIWKFQRALRYTEYYHNCRSKGIFRLVYKAWQYRLFRLQMKTGFHIPINVFGPGLAVSHIGPIVINGFAKVGKNCRLHPMTCIGVNGHCDDVATIGDNVYISTGVKIIGPVSIADGVCLGANAVVTKSIEEENTTWAVYPQRKYLTRALRFRSIDAVRILQRERGNMKKIMLYQHAGSYNHGCEALATTVSAEITRVTPDSKIYLCSHDADEDREFALPNIHEIIANKRWLRRWTLPWFFYQVDKRTFNCKALQEKIEIDKPCLKLAKDMDVCVAIGGDNYCYNKGKLYWPTERVIKKMGKKMMLWGCSVEPDELSGELSEHLSLFDAITVRESISYEAFVKCGLGDKAHLVADPAFLLEPEKVEFPEGWRDGQMVGINLSPMILNYTENREKVVESIHALVDYILKMTEMNVLLVPHVRLSFTDDMDTLRPIFEKYKDTGRVLLLDDYSLSCRQLKGYISACRFFIGARTHSIIAAYSTCVPALALGYSVKAKGIARDIFGSEENLVLPVQTFDDSEATVRGFEYLLEHEDEIRKKLCEVMPEYKEKARKSAEVFESLI